MRVAPVLTLLGAPHDPTRHTSQCQPSLTADGDTRRVCSYDAALTAKLAMLYMKEMASETGRLFTRRGCLRPGCIRQGARRGRRWSPAAVPSDARDTASRPRPATGSIAELLRWAGRVPARPRLSCSPAGRGRRRGVGRRTRLLPGRSSAGARLRVRGRGLQYSLPGTGHDHRRRRVVPTTRPDSHRHAVRRSAVRYRKSLSRCLLAPVRV